MLVIYQAQFQHIHVYGHRDGCVYSSPQSSEVSSYYPHFINEETKTQRS